MRYEIRPLTALLLTAVLIFTTAGFACDKKIDKAEFISYAKDINHAFISFGPIIAQDRPDLKARWDIGTGIAARVITAVEASNQTEVVALIADLIPLVNEVAAEFTNNRTALIILAGADIGLHFFVNHYTTDELAKASSKKGPSRAATSAPLSIEQYRQQRAWGCDYKPEKCKALKKAA